MANSSARSPRGRMESSRLPTSPSGSERARNSASLLGFHFRDPSLLDHALVHRSYCNEHGLDASDSYERLEFLGDAVLELIISDRLYDQFPDADEGQLTKARSSLVRGKVLAGVARRLGLGEILKVGQGVESSGGRDQDSVLAATFEAVIAAVYLDQGLEAVREFVCRNLAAELADIAKLGAPPENPKSQLQELLQGHGLPPPTYRSAGREGPDHSPMFRVEAVVSNRVIGRGEGGRKSDAEKAAAEDALALLQNDEFLGDFIAEDPGTTQQDAVAAPELPTARDSNGNPATGILKRLKLNRNP